MIKVYKKDINGVRSGGIFLSDAGFRTHKDTYYTVQSTPMLCFFNRI